MAHCTDRSEDIFTCMGNYSCHTCPYWSRNIKNKDEDENEEKPLINTSRKLTHKISKAETCENYNYWCGKLECISNCETCEFYESKN